MKPVSFSRSLETTGAGALLAKSLDKQFLQPRDVAFGFGQFTRQALAVRGLVHHACQRDVDFHRANHQRGRALGFGLSEERIVN